MDRSAGPLVILESVRKFHHATYIIFYIFAEDLDRNEYVTTNFVQLRWMPKRNMTPKKKVIFEFQLMISYILVVFAKYSK